MLFSKFEVRIVIGSIDTIWAHKVTQEMLTKILNYIKKIYAKKINKFWSVSISSFWSVGIDTILTQKIIQYKKASFTKILNLTKSSIIFYAKLYGNFHFKYYLHTPQTTFYLGYPILCHYLPPNLFIFDLYYSH